MTKLRGNAHDAGAAQINWSVKGLVVAATLAQSENANGAI